MMLVDTNVLIYAHRTEAERHDEYRGWLERLISGPQPYAVSDFALNGMVRIVTDQRMFKSTTPLSVALTFADRVRNQPHALVVNPGPRGWGIFAELCDRSEARGKLIPDAYLAALSIENACEFVTTDKDFRRFPGLRFRHPLG
jgi:toxin-antitoxin system PIN domain toxin